MLPFKKNPKHPDRVKHSKIDRGRRLIIVHLAMREHYTCAVLRASKVCASGGKKKEKFHERDGDARRELRSV